ncbi:MAG: ABC transporter permease [Gemmatimonadetes bacterium]|nr:ABC transporter permease [Gemmatimonadota bacterium]
MALDLKSDVRYALRGLRTSPGFSIVAIASLAIGIGATTAVFSLVNAVYLRPAEFPDEHTLVSVHEESDTQLCAGCGVATSVDGFRDWQAMTRSFSALAAYGETPFVIGGEDVPERVTGGLATANLFAVLGIEPIAGRSFTLEEDRPGAGGVVILSHALWRRRFAGDRAAVGARVRLNGEPHTVIGVMPEGFGFPDYAELWVPFEAHAREGARDAREYGVVARLASGVTLEQARTEVRALGARLAAAYPEQREWTIGVTSFAEDRDDEVGPYFWVLQGAVVFVLLIACANLTGLMLARASRNQTGMAIRRALGARRGRLVRELLVQSLALAIIGGGLGLLLAGWGIDAAVAGISAEAPYYVRFGIDARVVVFALATSLIAGLSFGVLPALRASAPDVLGVLRRGGPAATGTRSQWSARAVLVVTEMALALVLLAGAGLMIKTFLRLNRPAIEADSSRRVLLARLALFDRRFDEPAQLRSYVDDAVDRIGALPGATAAVEHVRFLAGFGATDRRIAVEGLAEVPEGVSPRFAWSVTTDWFGVMGTRVVAGRVFSRGDGAAEDVAVVNHAMAQGIWGSAGSALGRRIRLNPAGEGEGWRRIIGVVADAREETSDGRRPASRVWVPWARSPARPVTLIVGSADDPRALVPWIRSDLAQLGPDVPVDDIRTLEEDLARQLWPVRFYALVLTSFAGFAVLLASIGVWGIIAYTVSLRTREIGIRMALGARAGQVLRMVAGQGILLAGLALAIGLAGAAALTRVIGVMLYGTSPLDPAVFAVVSLLFAMLTLAAVLTPARRATRVDPLIALRSD